MREPGTVPDTDPRAGVECTQKVGDKPRDSVLRPREDGSARGEKRLSE